MKKMLSILLTAALMICTCSVMLADAATADKDKIFLQCFDNEDLECTVLIMTFDKSFTKIGDNLQVQLTIEKDNVQTIAEDKILREFHEAGAQLFICLPSYLSDEKDSTIPTSSILTVSEGAFTAEENELSPSYYGVLSVSDNVSRSTKDWEQVKDVAAAKTKILDTYKYGDTRFPIGSHPNVKKYKVVEGSEMRYTSANWAWTGEEITFTENGEQSELTVSAGVCGEHTVKGKVNDFIYDTFSFTVVSRDQAKKDSLWISFKQCLRSVYVIPIGLLIGFTMPGMFMIAGQFMWFERFFKQLFSKELIEDYVGVVTIK
ncbi:MAG: hypothetical protein IJB86_00935 [Clostridia bacterium]|nr:hypothetical protein [Clostridia bacterium]